MFFLNTCWTQLLAPLEILMSYIYLKYIPIHIHNFEHTSVIMNMKLSSHVFLFHRNINRRDNKVQIPLIIHHNEKNQIIYFWCQIFFRSKVLTMQIYFHSLLWSYLPRVPTILTTCVHSYVLCICVQYIMTFVSLPGRPCIVLHPVMTSKCVRFWCGTEQRWWPWQTAMGPQRRRSVTPTPRASRNVRAFWEVRVMSWEKWKQTLLVYTGKPHGATSFYRQTPTCALTPSIIFSMSQWAVHSGVNSIIVSYGLETTVSTSQLIHKLLGGDDM